MKHKHKWIPVSISLTPKFKSWDNGETYMDHTDMFADCYVVCLGCKKYKSIKLEK